MSDVADRDYVNVWLEDDDEHVHIGFRNKLGQYSTDPDSEIAVRIPLAWAVYLRTSISCILDYLNEPRIQAQEGDQA